MENKNTVQIIFGTKSEENENQLYIRIEDLEIPHGEDYKTALHELKKTEQISLDGVPFLELFKYKDISLWWYIYPTILPAFKQYVSQGHQVGQHPH